MWLLWNKGTGGGKRYREGGSANCFIFRQFTDQYEGRPEVGMGVLFAELLHSGLQGPGHVTRLNVVLVENLHECGRAFVVDVPKGEKQRSRASTEQPALKASFLQEIGRAHV